MTQSELIKIINDSVEQTNSSLLEWTNKEYFLGSPHIRSEGLVGSITMQNIMKNFSGLQILPEKNIKEILIEAEQEDKLDGIKRPGRVDVALYDNDWNLIYPIEIKRERQKLDVRSKMKAGCIKDIVRLAEMKNILPKMKAGILAVFIFEESSDPTKLDKKLEKRKELWKKALLSYYTNEEPKNVNILHKFSQNPPQRWEYEKKNGDAIYYIATSLCVTVKDF